MLPYDGPHEPLSLASAQPFQNRWRQGKSGIPKSKGTVPIEAYTLLPESVPGYSRRNDRRLNTRKAASGRRKSTRLTVVAFELAKPYQTNVNMMQPGKALQDRRGLRGGSEEVEVGALGQIVRDELLSSSWRAAAPRAAWQYD